MCLINVNVICYAMGGIMVVRVDAYHHMQAKSAYYMHAKLHFCVSIPQVFVFNWHTIYTHFHETGLHIQLNVHKETLFPP